jgi:hypothetical protein
MKTGRFFLVVLLIACAISIISIWKIFFEKSEYRFHYKGDGDSELNAYTAGLSFARYGFGRLYFLPATARYEESFAALMKQRLYTHYPPGSDLVSGSLQRFGIQGFYQQKAWILSLNLIAMVLLACATRRMLADERAVAPMIVTSVAVTSVWFVWWAGNLYEHTYNDLVMALGVWAVVAHKERLYLLACFMAMCFSFEVIPWLSVVGVFMAAQKVMAKAWNTRQALVFVAAMIGMFFLSFGIHLLQNAWYFHSLSAAIGDMRGAYQLRTGVAAAGEYSYSVAKHVVKGAYALLWFYGTAVLILAGIGLGAAIKRRLWLPVILLCAGFAWPIAFREHSMVHALTWRHLGVGLFLLATIGFLNWWGQAAWKKSVALLLLFVALFRIPLGCEISNNRLFLAALRDVVVRTDSATIAELVYFLKDNPEHRRGKTILIDELAARAHALPDQPAYTIVRNGKPFTVVRDEQGFSIWYRNLPKDRTPVFHDSAFAYVDATGPCKKAPDELQSVVLPAESQEGLSKAGAPIELPITGNPDKREYQLLLAGLLLQ